MRDIKTLKPILAAAGFEVSEGDNWTHVDYKSWLAYTRFNVQSATEERAVKATAYEGILEIEEGEDPEPPVDEAPVLGALAPMTVQTGEAISLQVTATGTAPITFSANTPVGLNMTEEGLLTGSLLEAGEKSFDVTATNSVGSDTKTLSITAMEEVIAPVVEALTDVEITLGESVNVQAVATGTAPITFTATGLPAGVTINAEGAIQGIPTATGNSTVEVTATNSAGSDSKSFTLSVKEVPIEAPVMEDIADVTVDADEALNINAGVLKNTAENVVFSATGLPEGAAMDAATGVITGAVAAPGFNVVTVTATNEGGADSKSFNLTVNEVAGDVEGDEIDELE